MASQKLTKTFVESLQAGEKDIVVWDAELKGFGVKITPKGRKVFVVQYRPKGYKGAAKKYTIGVFGTWTVQRARDRAREVLVDGSQGHDVGALEQAERMKINSDKIADVAAQFLEKYASQNRTVDETQRIFSNDIIPKIGKKSVHAITKNELINIVEDVNLRGAPIMANRTLATLRKFFNWCVSRAIIDKSPADGIAAVVKERSRDRVLSDSEVQKIYHAAEKIGYPFGDIVQLLFLTAQRRDEVAQMKWSELNLAAGVWSIPALRVKNGKAHDVHLSLCAMSILSRLSPILMNDGETSDFVFTTTGKTACSGFSRAKKTLDELSGVNDWRLHDIRRTVATAMSKLQVPIHVTEAILNHKSGQISGVAAVYQKHQFLDERKDALNKWSNHLCGLLA